MPDALNPLRVAIFGATSGIATAVARIYAARAGDLVLVGRGGEALASAAADLRVRGAKRIEICVADFMDIETLPELAEKSFTAFGRLDVALIAYGSLPDQAKAQNDSEVAHRELTINFVSPALLADALANRFEAQRAGVIAVITSVAGDRGRQSNYLYGGAKGGLQRFLEGLRHRLAPKGVTVLDIRPGFVSTQMTAHLPQGGPLWAAPDKVGNDIVAAIDGRRAVLYSPWFWRFIMTAIRGAPRALFHHTKL